MGDILILGIRNEEGLYSGRDDCCSNVGVIATTRPSRRHGDDLTRRYRPQRRTTDPK